MRCLLLSLPLRTSLKYSTTKIPVAVPWTRLRRAVSSSATGDLPLLPTKKRKFPPNIAHGIARIGSDDVTFALPNPYYHANVDERKYPAGPVETRPLASIFDDMDRVTHLTLFGHFPEEIMKKLSETPAPRLESFKLYPRYSMEQDTHFWQKRLPLMFAGEHPRLESLTLKYVSRLGDNKFSNLKRLHLAGQILVPDVMSSWTDVLNSSPELEALTFSTTSFGTGASGSPGYTPPCVQLSHLQKLTFKGVTIDDVLTTGSWIHADKGLPLSLAVEAGREYPFQHVSDESLEKFFELNPYGILDNATKLKLVLLPGKRHLPANYSLAIAGPDRVLSLSNLTTGSNLSHLLASRMYQISELWITCPSSGTDGRHSSFAWDLLLAAKNIRKLYVDFGAPSHVARVWSLLQSSWSSLEELHLDLPPLEVPPKDIDVAYRWNALRDSLEQRVARGLPSVSRLHIYSPCYPVHTTTIISQHEQWQTRIRDGQALPYVEDFVFHPVARRGDEDYIRFPRMGMPPVYSPTSHDEDNLDGR